MEKSIKLKGVVASRFLDPNNETLISVQTANSFVPQSIDASGAYKFEPHFSVSLRAADLGDPPVGATVEVTVKLS